MADIDSLIAEINKKYKTDVVRKASDLKSVEFIPYTSPRMNYITRGGVPESRVIEFVGLPSSGKTSTALDVLANYQQKYPDRYAVYLDGSRYDGHSYVNGALKFGGDLQIFGAAVFVIHYDTFL